MDRAPGVCHFSIASILLSIVFASATVPIFAQTFLHQIPAGPTLTDAYDVEVDSGGNLYVLLRTVGDIVKLNPAGEELLRFDGGGLMTWVVGLAFDADGYVYVADAGNRQVQKFDASGNLLKSLVDSGQMNQPTGIAVDGAGQIYVADSHTPTQVYRVQVFDAAGVLVKTIGEGYLSNPRGIALDGSGFLYVADAGSASILKFDPAGNLVASLPGVGARSPSAVAVDAAGKVYATNGYDLYVLDAQGELLVSKSIANTAAGLAVDAEGNIFVAHRKAPELSYGGGHDFVRKYDSALQYQATLGHGSAFKWTGFFRQPTGVAVDDQGNVFAHSISTLGGVYNWIQKFDPSGAWLRTYSYETLGTYIWPRGLATGPDQSLYVMSYRWGSPPQINVKVIDPEGNLERQIGSAGCGKDGGFKNPRGIGVNQEGHVFVSESDHSASCGITLVLEFDSAGQFLGSFGSRELVRGGGIAFDLDGSVLVADRHRIAKFDSSRLLVGEIGIGHLSLALDVAVDSSGYIYVYDHVKRSIITFDSSGEFLSKTGGYGAGPGEFLGSGAIASSPSGVVVVADTENHRVQVFRGVNQPPTADAGPDQTVQSIYADGSSPVTLDGSASFDPDGDELLYEWSLNGSPPVIGPIVTTVLPLGVHWITLTVDDGAETDSDEVRITVQATVQGLRDLLWDFVASGSVEPAIASKLDEDLAECEEHIYKGNFDKAIQALDRFKHGVDKGKDKGDITSEAADILMGSADAVIGTLMGND